MTTKVRMSNATYELLMELAKRRKMHPPEYLAEQIALSVASHYELDAILPEHACTDPRKVLAVVRQLSKADPSAPVTIEIPADVNGGEAIRAHRLPVGV